MADDLCDKPAKKPQEGPEHYCLYGSLATTPLPVNFVRA